MRKFVLSFVVFCLSYLMHAQVAKPEVYEKFGEIHNIALKEFFMKSHNELNYSNAVNYISDFLENYSKGDEVLRKNVIDVSIGFDEYVKDYIPGKDLNVFVDKIDNQIELLKNKFSTYEKKYLDVIFNVDDYNVLDDYLQRLHKQTTLIVADKNIDNNTKDILLFSISIAKHSALFWEKEGPQIFEKYRQTYQEIPKRFWRNFIKADIAGGVTGGVAGAFAGSVVLPVVGAVPGWVVGAVGTAIGASTGWAVAELILPE